MPFSLAATALSLDLPKLRRKHPNRLPFHGILTLVDVPSDRPPSGSNNRRVLIPRAVAEAALPSLIGMALDYTPTLDRHDSRRKIGIITAATINNAHVAPGVSPADAGRTSSMPAPTLRAGALGDGRQARPYAPGSQLTVRGFLYARDFPEVILELLRATSPPNFGAAAMATITPPATSVSVSAAANAPGVIRACMPAELTSLEPRIANREPPRVLNSTIAAPLGRRPATDDRRQPLGMSYEIAEAQIVSESSPIWVLQDFVFTGAAVLRRDHAAYQNTSIELLSD